MRFLCEAVGSTKNSENRTFEIHTQTISYIYGHGVNLAHSFLKMTKYKKKPNFILGWCTMIEARLMN